jgi:hypothetical protein
MPCHSSGGSLFVTAPAVLSPVRSHGICAGLSDIAEDFLRNVWIPQQIFIPRVVPVSSSVIWLWYSGGGGDGDGNDDDGVYGK